MNRRPIIERDLDYPNLYRIRWPDGTWSDMTNLSRAKDAINVREIIEAAALKKSGARRG